MSQRKDFRSRLLAGLNGKEETFQANEKIGRSLIERFAATIGDRNPLYWDDEYAKKSPFKGIVAPPTFVFEVNFDVGAKIGEDGVYQGLREWVGFDSNIQRAGNEYEMIRPVSPDDVISLRRRVLEVQEKKGKLGDFILLVTEITYTNQRGEILGIDRETLALPLPNDAS